MRAASAGEPAVEQRDEAAVQEAEPAGSAVFHTGGDVPAVAPAPSAAPGPSASDLAFGSSGGGRGAAGAGDPGDGKGDTLPDDVRGKFESSLGTDLSHVRVHTGGPLAASAGARALAIGSDIHFAAGQYDPHGRAGQELLAHEVAHTVQQRGATPQHQAKREQPADATSPAEADADRAASAMVTGQRTSVTPVAQQLPHAKEAEWMAPIRSSLKSGDWSDVALRLNGLAIDDIYNVVKGFTPGQRSHVRGAAQVVMAGWPEHVTEQIDRVGGEKGETDLQDLSAKYAAYERALAKARAGGTWSEVATRLVGMGPWDRDDRLGKMTWFELEKLRAATDHQGLLAAIDKADAARAARVLAAFDREVAGGQWAAACNHLNGMSADDIKHKLRPLDYTTLMAMKPFANPHIATAIDTEIQGRPKQEQDPTQPEQVTDAVKDVPLLVPVPDFSADTRTTKEAKAAGDWGGSAEVKAYFDKLAAAHGEREADQQLAKAKEPKPDRAALVAKLTAQYHADLKMQWDKTLTEYALNPQWQKFSQFARGFCADVGQGALFSLRHMYLVNLDKADNTFAPEPLEPMIKGGAWPVRHFTNEFMRNFPDTPKVRFFNYEHHGVGDFRDAGYCLDLFLDTAGTDADGFLPRETALQVIYNIKAHADTMGADWQCCYNDFSVSEAAREKFGNKIAYSGVGEKTPGHNWHGPLNLHIHLDLVPKKGTDTGGEKVPNPVGNPVPNETH